MKKRGTKEPLRPDATVYALDLRVLTPGDIVLTTSPGQPVSEIIKAVTGGKFSHAILVVKLPNGIESSDYGVVRFRLDRFVARNPNNIRVLRYNSSLPDDFAARLVRYADSQVAKEYAELDVLTALFSRVPRLEKGRFFCSQLVAACYQEAQINLFPKIAAEKVSPAMIATSSLLDDVKNAIKPVNLSDFPYQPTYFDGPNSQSPTEMLMEAFQKAAGKVRPVFLKHGIEVESLNDAMVSLNRSCLAKETFVEEIDRALFGAMIEARIGEIGRECWPADSDDFFLDFYVRNAIILGKISTSKQKLLLNFYDAQLEIAGETLTERDEFITAAKGAYLYSGLESTRFYLAACWDFYLMHKRQFLTMKRAAEMIRTHLLETAEI